jgi:CBS domain-containing protein
MNKPNPPLGVTCRVRDIMQAEVVSVRPESTVRELVRILAEHQIGGAPVVSEDGKLVGIVTTTDLVRLAAEAAAVPLDELLTQLDPGETAAESRDLLSFLATDAWGDAESLAPVASSPGDEMPGHYEEYTVQDIMRPATRAVAPDASLEALARIFLEGHVHRAPVMEGGRLVGIVTTFDVLRAVAGLVDVG